MRRRLWVRGPPCGPLSVETREPQVSDREKWLNGWRRFGNSVQMGSAVHCAGCGKTRGVACVVIPEGYLPPEKEPEWPFDEESCPVCIETIPREKTLQERLADFKAERAVQRRSERINGDV